VAIDFENPLTAGTVLVRSDIRSQNYTPGSAGWIIEADGDAEFNSVIIRGGTVASGIALYYDGTPALGNLILSIAATAGVDAFGNAYQAGLTAYGPDGTINLHENDLVALAGDLSAARLTVVGSGGGRLDLTPPAAGNTWVAGNLRTALFSLDRGGLILSSPSDSVNSAHAVINLIGGGPTTNDTSMLFSADRYNFNGDMEFDDELTVYNNNTYDTWTPTITAGGGTATLSTADGWLQRFGKNIFVYGYMVIGTAGSGATVVQLGLPITPWRGSANRRQNWTGAVRDGGYANPGPVAGLVFAGGAGATINRLVDSSGTDVTGAMLTAGSIWVFEGWLREA
jgi:hypothetical protein